MNKIEKGKRSVITIGVCALILALASIVGAVFVILDGVKSVAIQANVSNIFELVGGAILVVVAFLLIYCGIYFVWVGATLKAIDGSVAEANLSKGTVNMKKCSKCGSEVGEGDEVCANCGCSLKETKKCPKCDAEVKADAKHCTKCGEEL